MAVNVSYHRVLKYEIIKGDRWDTIKITQKFWGYHNDNEFSSVVDTNEIILHHLEDYDNED